MAGTNVVNNLQLGDSPIATRNFVWQTNNDGSAKLARGNVGATTQDILTVDQNGVISTVKQLTSGTAVATTSGTAVDFTSIPSWVKRITVMFNGVSLSGTSNVQVQLGTAGGVETTGYVSAWSQGTQSGGGTTGFVLFGNTATDTRYGALVISNFGTNAFAMHGVMSSGASSSVANATGFKTLTGTLDRIRITSVNGTDTFDGGSANIIYEG